MTNFDNFLSEAKFASFAEVAASAERIYQFAHRANQQTIICHSEVP